MTSDRGLILGIDVQESISQVCFYDYKSAAPEHVVFADKRLLIENPAALSDIETQNRQGLPVNMNEIFEFLGFLIGAAKKASGLTKIEKLCITVSRFEIIYLDVIRAALEKLLIPEEQWVIISHEECYAYYAYSQKKELYASGVLLLDYQKDGLHAHRMLSHRKNGIDFITEHSIVFKDEEIILGVNGEKNLAEIEKPLEQAISAVMADHIISSVYLTGPGFDVDEFPEGLTRVLCSRRKVFAGQNLYVKGACYCAYEEFHNDVFDNIILACNNRVTVGIETDILERGKDKRFRMVKPGTNWYMAERTMEFILEDVRQIKLSIKHYDSVQNYEEVIDISEIPYREGKLTRISLHAKFTASDRCMITIKDKGFGEFVKSSEKVIYKELKLR